MKELHKFSHDEKLKIMEDAWLGIKVNEDTLYNPLLNIPALCIENPELYITYIMSRPEYFSFICKYILNLEEVLPMQGVILERLWNHKLPMLIGSRGMSKSFTLAIFCILIMLLRRNRKIVIIGGSFRQSKIVFGYMVAIINNSPFLRNMVYSETKNPIYQGNDEFRIVFNSNSCTALPLGTGDTIRGRRATDIVCDEFACLKEGSLVETENGLIRVEDFETAKKSMLPTGEGFSEKPTKFVKTPLTDVYEIKLQNGYVIRCSDKHQVMTPDGWKNVLDLTSGDYVEKTARKVRSFFPSTNPEELDNSTAWLLGILTSEGSVTSNHTMAVTNTDYTIIDKLCKEYGFSKYFREAYIDDRGWHCKATWVAYKCDIELRTRLYELGLNYVTAHDKKIPWSILQSTKETVVAFLNGLFDGDGSCFLWNDKKESNRPGLSYYSVSERLCRDVQIICDKLGFDGYITKRRSKISDNWQWMVRWNNHNAYELGTLLNVDRFQNILTNRRLPSKTTNICFYNNRYIADIKIRGKKYSKKFKNKQDAVDYINYLKETHDRFRKVVSITKLDTREHLYDYYLPITHSFYAEGHRQHNTMPLDIFETIIAGFAAVSSSVVGNVKLEAKKRAAKMLGLTLDEMENLNLMEKTGDNKIVLAGTAYYSFNHFSQYHDKWRKIIKSRGNPKVLKAVLGEAPEDLDYRDYCVMRIPYELIPRGMMETAQMARSKISMTKDNYEREFGCIFSKDSNGFFKASVLERCTIKDGEDLYLPSGICVPNAEIFFEPRMEGDKSKRHVIGVDPAAMSDNLAIVILELDGQFRKIVHVWTTNKKEHLDKLRSGLTTEHNYYAYAARKIRELMKKFPCEILAIDPGGGGVSIMETLKDKDKMLPNEAPIYHVIDPNKPRPEEDGEPGLHIIEEAEYSSAKWRAEANHGMKKDFEELIILFPYIDPISYAIAETMDEDEEMDVGDDTLQRCINDIDKTKIELCSIVVTETPTGLEHWDTPETKTAVGKKTRMRKDRYSALLIANISARRLARTTVIEHEYGLGGFSSPVKKEENHGKLFTGPSWIADKLSECYR